MGQRGCRCRAVAQRQRGHAGGGRPRRGCSALDSDDDISLKRAVQLSPRASIETQLADLHRRERELLGEMGDAAQQIETLQLRDRPVGARLTKRLQRAQEAYWPVKARFDELWARMPEWCPPGVSAPGDF